MTAEEYGAELVALGDLARQIAAAFAVLTPTLREHPLLARELSIVMGAELAELADTTTELVAVLDEALPRGQG